MTKRVFGPHRSSEPDSMRSHVSYLHDHVFSQADRNFELGFRSVPASYQWGNVRGLVCARAHSLVQADAVDDSEVRDQVLQGLVPLVGNTRDTFRPGVSPNRWELIRKNLFKSRGFFVEEGFLEATLFHMQTLPDRTPVRDIHRAPRYADWDQKTDFVASLGPSAKDSANIAIQLTSSLRAHNGKVEDVGSFLQYWEPDEFSDSRDDPIDCFLRDGFAVVSLGNSGGFSENEIMEMGCSWLDDPKGMLVNNYTPNRRQSSSSIRKKRLFFHDHSVRFARCMKMSIQLMKSIEAFDNVGSALEFLSIMKGSYEDPYLSRNSERIDWEVDMSNHMLHMNVFGKGTFHQATTRKQIVRNRLYGTEIPSKYRAGEVCMMKVSVFLTDALLQRLMHVSKQDQENLVSI